MLIDHFECERTVIRQYIRLQLEKGLRDPQQAEPHRLPYQVYSYCSQIFKKEAQVCQYLLQLFQAIFYLHESRQIKETPSRDELSILYRQLLSKKASNKWSYLGQINCRLVLLGLSVKIGKRDREVFRRGLRDLVKKLQIELVLVLDGQESLSQVIVRELQLMREGFCQLEYLEEVGSAFEKYEVGRVVRWVHGQQADKRTQFHNKTQNAIPFRPEEHKPQANQTKQTTKRVNLCEKPAEQPQGQHSKTESFRKEQLNRINTASRPEARSKTVSKTQTVNESLNKKQTSYISQAIKMRQSMRGGSRLSSRYTFKSSKKCLTQEIIEYVDYQPETTTEVMPAVVPAETRQLPSQIICESPPRVEYECSASVLCDATPPRPKRPPMGQQ